MKSFLRFIGALLFIFYVIGAFIYAFNVPLKDIFIFYFCIYLIFGPTLAVILFAVARILENTEINESKINKLNKKIDLLLSHFGKDNPSLNTANKKINSDGEEDNQIVFKALTEMTTEEKKKYKTEIHNAFTQFSFYKYDSSVKDRMTDVRNEAVELIDGLTTVEDAEKTVQAFKDALADLEK